MKPDMRRAVQRRTLSWRWRRNALRTRSYVVEGWVLLAVWVVAVLGGTAAAVAAGHGVMESTDRQRSERRRVVAVLTEDPIGGFGYAEPRAQVAWTTRAGLRRSAETRVGGAHHRGDRVTVWVDRQDHIVSAPLSAVAARAEGAMTAIGAAAATAGLAAVLCVVATGLAERRRAGRWAAEWADTGPDWDRHTA